MVHQYWFLALPLIPVKRISTAERSVEERLDQRVPIGRRTELGQDIRWVILTIHVNKVANPTSLGFASSVVVENVVSFQETTARKSRAVDNTQVISKDPSRTLNGNTKHAQRVAQVNDLIDGSSSSHKFRSICSSLNSSLFFEYQSMGVLLSR